MESNEGLKLLTNMIKSAVDDVIALDNALTEINSEPRKIDNVVRINGNNFTDYDKAIDYIEKLKNREVERWYLYDVDRFGIGYAILKWCKANNKYYNEKILNSVLDEDAVSVSKSSPAENILKLYNKRLELDRYRGKRYEGLIR